MHCSHISQILQAAALGLVMLTLPALAFHFLQKATKEKKQNSDVKHPFESPHYQTEKFPASAQFLDFQWTPEGLSGQARGVLSGLKPLHWRNLLNIDRKQFTYELSLKKELMRAGGPYREKVTAGLDGRLDAQKELLGLVLENLRSYHTNTYHFTAEGFTILPNVSFYRSVSVCFLFFHQVF